MGSVVRELHGEGRASLERDVVAGGRGGRQSVGQPILTASART